VAKKSKVKPRAHRGRKVYHVGPIPSLKIAEFMARPEGASMDELVEEFGIKAHPMRAKVFYVKHNMGWKVERVDGRYHATAPIGEPV
jgi:hypothetical protein